MIQDYEKKYELAVDGLGRLVSSSYDARMLGEYEKILVYTKEDDVIGFIQYSKLYEVVDILYIAVDERFRHLGVGSELIDRLCRDLEIKKIILEVRASNEGAISFYEKNGFTKIRPIKNYYKDGEDAIAMEKVIQ